MSLFFLPSPPNCEAASSFSSSRSSKPQIYLGTGIINYNVSRFGKDDLGNTSLMTNIYPELNASVQFSASHFRLAPTFGYTVLGKKNYDSEKTSLMLVTLPFIFNVLHESLEVKVGPGVEWYSIAGVNATSSTEAVGYGAGNYTVPDNTKVTSRILVLNLGVGKSFKRFRADMDALVSDALSSSRRSISVMANLSYAVYNP